MDKIIKLTKTLKSELDEEELVKEFLKVKEAFKNNKELESYRKQIALLKENNDPSYSKVKKEYESHPIFVNYFYLKGELYDLLKEVIDELDI